MENLFLLIKSKKSYYKKGMVKCLQDLKSVTYNEKGWDRASEIDMRMAEKYFEAA